MTWSDKYLVVNGPTGSESGRYLVMNGCSRIFAMWKCLDDYLFCEGVLWKQTIPGHAIIFSLMPLVGGPRRKRYTSLVHSSDQSLSNISSTQATAQRRSTNSFSFSTPTKTSAQARMCTLCLELLEIFFLICFFH